MPADDYKLTTLHRFSTPAACRSTCSVRLCRRCAEGDLQVTEWCQTGARAWRILWSAKESFVKMDGRGLGYGISSVNLAAMLPMRADCVEVLDGISYMTRAFEQYTLAGCVHKRTEIPVYVFSEMELLDRVTGNGRKGTDK